MTNGDGEGVGCINGRNPTGEMEQLPDHVPDLFF